MNRSKTKIVVVVACLALALWLVQRVPRSASAPAVGLGDPGNSENGSTSAALLTPGHKVTDRATGVRAARAKSWRVEVVDGEGTPLDEVSLQATLGAEVLEATGAVDWPEPTAGTWQLEVRSSSHPTWLRTVLVPADRATVTRVTLGIPHALAGQVFDSYGDPRRHHFVGFVPNGGRAPQSPSEWLELPHGRTDLAGRFTGTVPRQGRWRLFVGFGGRVMFEDERLVEFTEKGPFDVEIVVQAPTRLLLEAHEPGGLNSGLPVGVSVYRRKDILDRERPLPPQIHDDSLPDLDDPSLDEESRLELAAAIEAQQAPVDEAVMAYRMSVVPAGWRVDRSSLLDAQRRLLLEFLPANEELRFAVSRGAEVFFVEGSAFVPETPPLRVRFDLPAPLEPGVLPGATPGAIRATSEPVVLPRAVREVGATWR